MFAALVKDAPPAEKPGEVLALVSVRASEAHLCVQQKMLAEQDLEKACELMSIHEVLTRNLDSYASLGVGLSRSEGDGVFCGIGTQTRNTNFLDDLHIPLENMPDSHFPPPHNRPPPRPPDAAPLRRVPPPQSATGLVEPQRPIHASSVPPPPPPLSPPPSTDELMEYVAEASRSPVRGTHVSDHMPSAPSLQQAHHVQGATATSDKTHRGGASIGLEAQLNSLPSLQERLRQSERTHKHVVCDTHGVPRSFVDEGGQGGASEVVSQEDKCGVSREDLRALLLRHDLDESVERVLRANGVKTARDVLIVDEDDALAMGLTLIDRKKLMTLQAALQNAL